MKVVANITLRVGTPEKMEYVPPGVPVNLPADEARELIERELAEKASPKDEADDDLIEAIVDAIGDLSPDAYGKDGKPTVRAIEDLLGRSITAAERDQAWGEYQKLAAEV